MKRTVVIGIIAALTLLAAGLGYLFWLNSRVTDSTEALRAIPIDAGMVVRVQSLEGINSRLKNDSKLWSGLSAFQSISQADRILQFADSLAKENSSFNRLMNENPIFISVHAIGKGDLMPLLITNMSERVRVSDLLEMIHSLGIGRDRIEEQVYNGIKIHTISNNSSRNSENYAIAFHRGVAIFSPSILLVESAIGQLDSDVSLMNDRGFMEILRTAGTRVDANVLINHQRLPIVFAQQIHRNHRAAFQSLTSLAGWTELDLTIRNDAVWLNGFSQADDSLNTFYQVFRNQRPVPLGAHDVLPAQTSAVFFLGISNFEKYIQSYERYLEGRGQKRAYQQKVNQFGSNLGVDLKQFYQSFFSSEVALAYIPFDDTDFPNRWFVTVNTRGQSHSRAIILDAIRSYAQSKGTSMNEFQSTFRVDRDKSVDIYRMPQTGLHSTLFGNLFAEANDQFFTFIDSYVVFGSSVEGLSRLILANVHNKQLAMEMSYRDFCENLAPESNFTAYINPGRVESLYGRILAPEPASRLLARMETTGKLQGVALQLSGGRNMVFNSIFARYAPMATDDPQTVWETRLDTTFSMKPQLVINHNTQHREIFVQDNQNNIYLINDIGRILWKRPLPEPIIGEVHQVDLYRNGKLQLLFNTRSSLYVVDRNGNNVSGFPVTLRSPATNPVAAFDYEGNRSYRFFIAGEDRQVYVYDRSGNTVTGWDFNGTERAVTKPIQHFRVDGRDYIVLADANRPYILNRRGEERVKPERFFSQAIHSTFSMEASLSDAPPRLITTDSMGVIRFIYLDGKVDNLTLRSMSSNHSFVYHDVSGNGVREFIFLDGDKLHVYNRRGNELFSYSFKHNTSPEIIYFHFGARDRKLGILSSEQSLIYLINGDGTIYKGFPLRGITPFSIGQFANTRTRFNLVVGSSAGFVLNYAVQ